VEGAPRRDEKTGLYEGGVGVAGEFKLPLAPTEVPGEAKHNHVVTRYLVRFCFIHYIYFIFEF
jgi:hypothetical protein